MAPKKKATKNSFSSETKAEAMRLIFEGGFTSQQAADHIGCSVNAISNWRAAAKKNGKGKAKAANKKVEDTESAEPTVKAVKKVKKTKKAGKKSKKVAKKAAKVVSADVAPCCAAAVSFDEFVQGYWSECKGATVVLQLSPDIAPQAVEYVNNVLRYAYNQLCGE